jgi:uncharacterized protein with beta-barrel porin domain
MNRVYRVVWNAATCAWQAVAEIAKGQGKSQSTGSTERASQAVTAPAFKWSSLALAVAAALAVAPVHAGGFPNPVIIMGPETATQSASDADATLTVMGSGSITVNGAGAQTAVDVSFTGNNSFTTSIQNARTISATSTNANAKAISVVTAPYHVGTGNITITNLGSITATSGLTGSAEGGIFVRYQDSLVNITNAATGTITVGGGDGNNAGIRLAESNLSSGSTITNNGGIAVTGDYGTLFGIRHSNGALNNTTISNSGSISVTDGGSGFGISADDLFGSSIINTASGSITVTSSFSGSEGYGIRVRDVLQSQAGDRARITNQGAIDVSVAGTARGIYLDEAEINEADITNAVGATINVTSTADRAQGIYLYSESVIDLNLTNSGTMTVSGNNSADGINLYYEDDVDVVNSTITNAAGATIDVTATAGDARGISVISDSSLEIYNTAISNAGTITVTGYGRAIGLQAGGELQASSVTNSGTINVTSTNGDITGVRVHNMVEYDVGGTVTQSRVTNSGTINLIGFGGTGADNAYGIKVDAASNASTIVNAGTIRSLNASVPNGDVHGIHVEYLNDAATITNSGTISLADGNTTYGIKVDNLSSIAPAAINNSGTITVNSNGWGQGIYVGGSGEILNSGTITSTFDGEAHFWAYSITSFDAGVNATNTSTGVLNGNLYLAGRMTNAGTISLPHSANGGRAYVGTFINSGTLKIGLLTDGTTTTHSQLFTNTATFNAGSEIAVNVLAASTNVGMLVGQTLNDVVKATTTLTLNATPTVTDNSALLNFEFVQDGNNIDLNVVEGTTILDSTIAGGGNTNATSAATALQAIQDGGANPAMNPVFTALNGLQTDEQVAAAVNSFTPVTTIASVGAGTQIANSIQGIVELRQNANFGGVSGGLNSGDPLLADRNFWVKPFGSWGEQQNKSGLNGFDLKTRGIGFGLDGEYARNQKLGFAFFYTNADVDVNNMAQKADIEAYSALFYGTVPVFDDKTNFLFQAGYTAQKTDTSRFIGLTGDTAKGDYTAKVASLDLKLVRDYQVSERLLLQPRVSVTYRHLKNPSYNETGAGALNQNVDSFSESQTTLGIGARMHYMLDEVSSLMANVNYGRDLRSNALTVSTAFEGAPGVKYQTRGIDNGRNNYELGLGYERNVSNQSKVNVMYTHQGRGSSFKNDAISATYNLKF